MKLFTTKFTATVVLAVSPLFVAGCGSPEQEYVQPQATVEVKASDNVRTWLQGVAESGQLDSGASVIKDDIEKLRAEGVDGATVDELLQDADELIGMSQSSQITAKANDMLGKLPQ